MRNQIPKWIYSIQNNTLFFEIEDIEDPSAFPKLYIAEVEDENTGISISRNMQEITENEHDNLIDIECYEVDFKEFALEIQKFITCEYIQITCDASDRKGHSYWEQLSVYSNGTGVAVWKIKRANGEVIN